MKKAIILMLSFFICMSITAQNEDQAEWLTIDGHTFEAYAAPNMVRISENFYADQTEATNIFYKEYLFWLKSVFGAYSQQYLDAQPDASVWHYQQSTDLRHDEYFWSAEFDEYPLVGITLEQAKKYSDWRTDRVVEATLIENKFIKINSKLSPDNYFTIDKLVKGEYPLIKRLNSTLVFPRFTIPTVEEWQVLSGIRGIEEMGEIDNQKKEFKSCPMYAARNGSKNRYDLYHVIGNVAEMVDQHGIAKGGGWNQNLTNLDPDKNLEQNIPNCWTGFRNICRWEILKLEEVEK